ncbi:glycosyltransferase [Bacteroides sp. 519]|uniref:glycosyltransferase n=1 Tax=Bacteroides sp. 519 TaxID=2302937 RepID=UPI0013D194AE|nr:glycosyltransferase [Bacteroides sp. 519]NDV59579.1 glycosyltransferase [Bacteroides sp. 519]
MELPEFNNIELILLASISILFIIQISYYLSLYNRINQKNKAGNASSNTELPPVSVIIYAKDELPNLRKFLPSVLEQDYPTFEVIVINDNPTDGSDDYLKLLAEKYPHLYNSFTPDSSLYISHKKLAIMLGIKASKYNWLVFTDANCRPASANWLRLLARNFTPATDIVLGCHGYEKGKRWMNKKISFDTLFSSMRILGFALAGDPYAGCGRNMAYRKELFYKSKGFSDHLNLKRGDDDLFINQVAKSSNTKVETSADAMIWMNPLEYQKPWREDKLNYVVTSGLYKGIQKYLLGAETFSRLLFYVALIGCMVYGIIQMNYILIGAPILLWGIRFAIQASIINNTAKSIGDQERYYLSLPVFDFIQPLQSVKFRIQCLIRGKRSFTRK